MTSHIIDRLHKNSPAIFVGTGLTFTILGLLLLASSHYIHAVYSDIDQSRENDPLPRIFAGQELIPVSVGSHQASGSHLVIEEFDKDQAVFALPWNFEAGKYPFIELKVSGNAPHLRAKIMWEAASTGGIYSQFIRLNRAGYGRVFLGNNLQYQGSINSIALLFFDGPEMGVRNNGGANLRIHSIKLTPSSPAEVFAQLLFDRLNISDSEARANNFVRENSLLSPVTPTLIIHLTFLTVLLCIVGAMLAVPALRTNSTLVALTASLTICVVLQDVARWKWRYDQHKEIAHRYSDVSPQDRYTLNHTRCALFPNDCGANFKPYF